MEESARETERRNIGMRERGKKKKIQEQIPWPRVMHAIAFRHSNDDRDDDPNFVSSIRLEESDRVIAVVLVECNVSIETAVPISSMYQKRERKRKGKFSQILVTFET